MCVSSKYPGQGNGRGRAGFFLRTVRRFQPTTRTSSCQGHLSHVVQSKRAEGATIPAQSRTKFSKDMPGFLGSGRNKCLPAVITVGKACLSLWGGGGSPRKLRFRRWFPIKAPQIMSQTQYVPCLLGALRQLGAMYCPFNTK